MKLQIMKNHIAQINYNRCKIFIGLLLISMLSLSCESFVEVDLPDSQLTGETVFNDLGTAEAAVTSIYSKLSNNVLVCGNSKGLSILLGSYTDELQTYNTGLLEFQFFQNNIVSTNTDVSALWNGSYNLIYAANAVKEGLENSTAIPQSDKDRLVGEVVFLRAYIHFYLLNLFGEIPYVTSTNYTINTSIGKLPEAQVYDLILNDLDTAKLLLPTVGEHPLKARAGISAVRTLLARVQLYRSNWTAAASEADSIINSGNVTWVDSLQDVFLKNSTGTIWQLMPAQEGLPTQEGQSFIFTAGPPPNRALAQNQIEAFETGDLRKEYWVGSISENGQIWHYPFKYKQSVTEGTSSEYSILLRLEELYLIRAESRAHLGDLAGAKSDINKIRNRASLPDTSADTSDQLLTAIIQERRVEFFTEFGHRFFDLKRTGLLNSALTPGKLGWNSTDILWPIPESELLLNPNLLPQNSGY